MKWQRWLLIGIVVVVLLAGGIIGYYKCWLLAKVTRIALDTPEIAEWLANEKNYRVNGIDLYAISDYGNFKIIGGYLWE